MERSDLGFQTDLVLNGSDSLNFCFKNSSGEWDNNNGNNYIFPIEQICTDLIVTNEENSLSTKRRLRKTYILSKKIKLAVYKIISYLPKLISGNYKRKANNEEL